MGERLILDLRRKDCILRALSLAVKSLWPHKAGSWGEIQLARWKLMQISDQAKDLVKIVLYVSFSTAGWFTIHAGFLINRLCESRKVPCDDLCGQSERFTE